MLIGYARISKNDGSQILDRQRDALIEAGVDPNNIYEDSVSGTKENRVGLANCMKALREGDTLIVWSLDRLGRGLRHLLDMVDGLNKRQIHFKVLSGYPVDTSTAHGEMLFHIVASFIQFERNMISERTKSGLAAARARGRMGGRPRKITMGMLLTIMAAMKDRSVSISDLAKDLGISYSTIYQHVQPNGEPTEKGQKLIDLKRKKK